MLEFLDESVGLQDIDDTNKKKEILPLVIPGRDAPRWHVRSLLALLLGLVNVVDRNQEGVVHDLE